MLVTIYTHNFAVTGHDRYGFNFLRKFGLDNFGEVDFRAVKANKWRRKMGQDPLPVIKRVHSTRTKNGQEFRFHVNCLELFKQAIAKDELLASQVTYVEAPLYTPTKLDIKVLPKYSPFDEQIPLIAYLSDPNKHSKVLSLRTGGGKMQHPKEPVLTYKDGWVPIGRIREGDIIIRPDGTLANVTQVFKHKHKKLYEFKLEDGRKTYCGLEHLWGTYVKGEYKVMDTEDIQALLERRVSVSIPNISLYDGYATKDPEYLGMAPFLLGYLFANAVYRDKALVINIPSNTELERVKGGLAPLGLDIALYSTTGNRFKIVAIDDPSKLDVFMRKMKRLGIAHLDGNARKLSPCYTDADNGYRFSLYKGIKAGLGYKPTAMKYTFNSIFKNVSKTLAYLARSVGFKVTTGKTVVIRKDVNDKHRVTVEEVINPTVKVRSITPIKGTHDAVCIEIDAPDSLYVTRDFIVTHNTYCSLQAAVNIGGRIMVTIETKFFKLWEEALLPTLKKKPNPKQILDLKTEEVLFVQGGKDLKTVMHMALNDQLGPYKAIVMAARTFTLYLEAYEAMPKHYMEIYPIHPVQFYEALDIGTRIKDELHLGLASNFKEELYLHTGNSISLSATLENGTFKDSILGWMHPMKDRAPASALKKYIDCNALTYSLAYPDQVRCTVRGSTDYNHNEYEKWILKDKNRTKTYLSIVTEWIETRYLKMREKGQGHKACIFATSIDMATAMRTAIRKAHPHLTVNRYASSAGDEYDKAKDGDVLVTTIQSFGTGFDLEGLICSLMTTAIDSPDSNIQTLGRLRELKKWPHITPLFEYLVCLDIPKHMQYHENKIRLFSERVKSHRMYRLNKLIV